MRQTSLLTGIARFAIDLYVVRKDGQRFYIGTTLIPNIFTGETFWYEYYGKTPERWRVTSIGADGVSFRAEEVEGT